MSHIIFGMGLLIFGNSPPQNQEKMKTATCMEVVTFKTNPEYTNEQMQKAMETTNDIVKGFDGFVSRNISQNENGEFIDVVLWETKEQALKAAKQVPEIPGLVKNFALIDPKSVVMKHYTIFAKQ